MQMKSFLGYPDYLRMSPFRDTPLEFNYCRWKKALCPKIGKSEVLRLLRFATWACSAFMNVLNDLDSSYFFLKLE